jgi:hypothetical protein
MTRTPRRNPLVINASADIPLASEEPAALKAELLYDYSQIDAQHRNQVMLSARRIKVKAERSKHDLLDIGKELVAVKERLEHGQFTDWIEQEFGMSMRTAQRFMNVYETYGGKNDTVSFLHDSALYMLSGPNIPEAARQEVEEEAKATGKSPTKARVKQIIDQHKASRTLTLDETIAVVWRAIKHNLSHTNEAAARLAWLQSAAPKDFLALLNASVTLDASLLVAARKRVEAELRGQLQHAQQLEQRRTPQPGQADSVATLQARINTLISFYQQVLATSDEYVELTATPAHATSLRMVMAMMIAELERKRTE